MKICLCWLWYIVGGGSVSVCGVLGFCKVGVDVLWWCGDV